MYIVTIIDEDNTFHIECETAEDAHRRGREIIQFYCGFYKATDIVKKRMLRDFTASYDEDNDKFAVGESTGFHLSIFVEKVDEKVKTVDFDNIPELKISKDEFKDKLANLESWYAGVIRMIKNIEKAFGKAAAQNIYWTFNIDYTIELFENMIGDKMHCVSNLVKEYEFDYDGLETNLKSSPVFRGVPRPTVYDVDSFYDYVRWMNRNKREDSECSS